MSQGLSDASYISVGSNDDAPIVPVYTFDHSGRGYGAASTASSSPSKVDEEYFSVAGDRDSSFESVSDDDDCDPESEASDDSDDETEPTSVYGVYPSVVQFFKSQYADIDMLIVHGFKVRKMITGFPLSLITLSSEVTRHRGLTERSTMVGGPHEILQTALYLGKFDAFQILIEGISGRRQREIKAYFLKQLQSDKSLYGGWVSGHNNRGLVVKKGCVITVSVFLKLCRGINVRKITLGRFGQKTPWAEFQDFYRYLVPHCDSISMDVAFTFPVPPSPKHETTLPLFSYASNPSRASLMFHDLGQQLLNNKLVNYGWVRSANIEKIEPKIGNNILTGMICLACFKILRTKGVICPRIKSLLIPIFFML